MSILDQYPITLNMYIVGAGFNNLFYNRSHDGNRYNRCVLTGTVGGQKESPLIVETNHSDNLVLADFLNNDPGSFQLGYRVAAPVSSGNYQMSFEL